MPGEFAKRRLLALRELARISEVVGVGDKPERFFLQMEHLEEPYELGVAVTLPVSQGAVSNGAVSQGANSQGAISRPELLVYYNPRIKSQRARERMTAVLADMRFSGSPMGTAFDRVSFDKVSTVLGLAWSPKDGSPAATVYLEEASRLFSEEERTQLTGELAAMVGTNTPENSVRVGSLYIWAYDIPLQGPSQFKIYHASDHTQKEQLRQELLDFLGAEPPSWCNDLLFAAPQPEPAYITQRRYSKTGSPVAHKIYRCFKDYAQSLDRTGSAELITKALVELRPGKAGLDVLEGLVGKESFPATSFGLAFAPGTVKPIYATGYWCLLRGGS